jgi:hypothetical protein
MRLTGFGRSRERLSSSYQKKESSCHGNVIELGKQAGRCDPTTRRGGVQQPRLRGAGPRAAPVDHGGFLCAPRVQKMMAQRVITGIASSPTLSHPPGAYKAYCAPRAVTHAHLLHCPPPSPFLPRTSRAYHMHTTRAVHRRRFFTKASHQIIFWPLNGYEGLF